MNKLAQLRERRNAKAKAAHEMNAKFPADQRMPVAEAAQLDAILAEVGQIDDEIAREQRVLAIEVAQNPQAQEDALRDRLTRDPQGAQNPEAVALRAFLTGGVGALTEEQRNAVRARQNQDIRNAMSTTTPSEGGYTVATEYYKQLEVALKLYGGIRELATIMRTGTGATMNFPTADPTAEVGEILGQNAAAAALDTTVGNIALDVYKYSSKKIALPFELIQDSFIDIEAYINDVLAMRLGRIQATHFATGTGSSQPFGLVTGASSGKVGLVGQTLTVIYDDLVDLEHSVDPLYRKMPGVGFLMNDSSVKVVRKVKDGNSRPIFVPGYETNNPGGAPDRLLGRPLYISQEIASMAANAKSILFGAFKKFVVRDVADLTLFRMTDSAFTLNGQVGFVGFMRTGSRLIDVGGAVKYYANSAT